MRSIFQSFPITSDEYAVLETKFDDLCKFAAWQLIRKNKKNNLTDEWQDVAQELRLAVVRAGSYYKRQCYIEECLRLAKDFAKDEFMKHIVEELDFLWRNKTKHGANRVRFGEHQEKILDHVVEKCVPKNHRPDRRQQLNIDKKFAIYAKAICWNHQRSLGRKITRERAIRCGLVSLSEWGHLKGTDN